jgi:tRNA dimethylallyltransferase
MLHGGDIDGGALPWQSRHRAMTTRPVLVIAGPTASGKSAIALALAERLDGVIINADALQLYRELEVLTARPGAAELARAPHRLYGALAASDACSAARWRALALDAIAAAAPPRLPIVVGGTGLYLRALLRGLAPMPTVPAAIRRAAAERRRALGPDAFHREVAARDPQMAARLPSGDTQRLIRAWEIFEATGRPWSTWILQPDEPPPAGLRFAVMALAPPRPDLYRAIDRRLAGMLERGALDEVRRVMDLDPALPIHKALGVRELARHLRGEVTLDAALAATQQATRHYAKRQMTWLRHQLPEATWFCAQYSDQLDPEIFSFIRNMG